MYTIQHVSRDVSRPAKAEKETIHSGHFMVSHFEAEEQDDEDNVAVEIPETTDTKTIVPLVAVRPKHTQDQETNRKNQQQLAIDTSLTKLFQCMSLAYRQKLTSPKWNRFRGVRLRWKDKIRLNNVIWRCWHLQFIKKERTLVCQFASPLDVDTHNKPEAIVLEGKYWKRKLATVTAEYKRWRMFYRNNILGHMPKDAGELMTDMDLLVWNSNSSDNVNMLVDEDYMVLMSDTLFSTITNQPYPFPDSREIAKAGLADFIQPSLGPLQPNLDDYMDIDPIQELMNTRLATVPEESQNVQPQSQLHWGYVENPMPAQTQQLEVPSMSTTSASISQYQMPLQQIQKQENLSDTQTSSLVASPFNDFLQPSVDQLPSAVTQYVQHALDQPQPPSYPSVISKTAVKTVKNISMRGKAQNLVYSKSLDNVYSGYGSPAMDRLLDTASQQMQPAPVQVSDIHQYKLMQSLHQNQRQGYKFPMPSAPNIKFTAPNLAQQQVQPHSHVMQSYSQLSYYSSPAHPQKDVKPEPRRKSAPRGRGRSRSNTREPIKRPPLISAVSDPSLITPQTSVLLTQLLSSSSNDANILYHQTRAISEEMISNQVSIKKEDGGAMTILPQTSPTTLIIPAQVSITAQPSSSDPLLLNTFSNSNSPIMDPLSQNIHSPTSSQGSVGSPAESSQRDRRVGHIHAEQKRRYNIKNGFDMLYTLIPHLNQNPNAKLSKAAMLQKGAEYISQLKLDRDKLRDEMESLKHEIEALNTSISNCQSMLPATGAPVSRRRDSRMQEMFNEYVQTRTRENWKFWIFSLICRPLLSSFNNFVSTSSLDDLYSSTMHWIEQHCTLVDLRPVVLNSLKYLCTKTDILSDPDKLPDEARGIAFGTASQNPQNN